MKKINLLIAMFFYMLLNAQVSIGNGTETEVHIPLEMYYKYSYTQSIYKNTEIGGSGAITGLKWRYDDASTQHTDNIEIYIAHTSLDEFSGTDQWLSLEQLTMVFSGEYTFNAGWVEIMFDTPFEYNGVNNIVIAARENTDSYGNNSDEFWTTAVTEYRSLTSYSDDVEILASAPPTEQGSGYYLHRIKYVPNVELLGITQNCPGPNNVALTNATINTAQISWDEGEATQYKVFYKKDENFDPTTDTEAQSVIVEENNALLTGLDASSTYFYYCQSVCDGVDGSWAGPFTFQTAADNLVPPYSTGFENGIPIGWVNERISGKEWDIVNNETNAHNGTKYIEYRYHTTENADSWLFTNGFVLEAGVSYDVSFFQRVYSSSYPEDMKFTVGTEANSSAQTTVLIDLPQVTNNTYEERAVTFTPESDGVYFFGFHSYSAANQYLIFIDDFSITQSQLSTNDASVKENKVKLYPNPVKAGQDVILTGDVASVEVFTTAGQLVKTIKGSTFNTSGLTAGVYIVRIKTETGKIETQKLLIK